MTHEERSIEDKGRISVVLKDKKHDKEAKDGRWEKY